MTSDTPSAQPTTPPLLPPQSRGAERAARPSRPGPPPGRPRGGLDGFNDAPPAVAEAALLGCCGSLRWARRVAAHRPYPDVDALLAAADEAAYDLSPADLAEALAGEAAGAPPDIAPTRGSLAAHTALRAAQAAYEARFGHVFVVSLDGVDPDETLGQLLASLRRRLGHDPDEERVVAAEELRRVTRTRLARLARGDDPAGQGVPGGYTHPCGIDHT
ncbi:2-oxo-4-hydroxy-4-carboxy-5-ureidoimidazoline decarboxylase [Streptomyces sp. MI02-7b]|uniref:2-oxo-4-hydroxy-4-carboxy-5-ureidoimidazoline decarboxylase n=1 Tax=Streptomyces sp. MI02-7b TaxID=462941 RepID=UPI0039F62664